MNQGLDLEPAPVSGFTSEVFETVSRGAEIQSHDGSALEKRPDMTFRRQGKPQPAYMHYDRTYHALFVECKIVDLKHPITCYWRDGMARFIRGEYAWRMKHSLMVAYALGSQKIIPNLSQILSKAEVITALGVRGSPRLRDSATNPVFISLHDRTPSHLGELEIAHLWLYPS